MIHGSCRGIRIIHETTVAPAGTPGIDENPCAGLVLIESIIFFTVFAVAIKVELNAVVPSDKSNSMVNRLSHMSQILLSYHAGSSISLCVGYCSCTGTADATTQTEDTTGCETLVTIVVVEPPLYSEHTLWSGRTGGEVTGMLQTILHGSIPSVITLHPPTVTCSTRLN